MSRYDIPRERIVLGDPEPAPAGSRSVCASELAPPEIVILHDLCVTLPAKPKRPLRLRTRRGRGVNDKSPGGFAIDLVRAVLDHASAGEEHFFVLHLNERDELIAIHEAGIGLRDGVAVDVKLVALAIMATSAKRIILSHNHPSGQAAASPQDRELTEQLTEFGRALGFTIVDHIIVSPGDNVFSFNDAYGSLGDYASPRERISLGAAHVPGCSITRGVYDKLRLRTCAPPTPPIAAAVLSTSRAMAVFARNAGFTMPTVILLNIRMGPIGLVTLTDTKPAVVADLVRRGLILSGAPQCALVAPLHGKIEDAATKRLTKVVSSIAAAVRTRHVDTIDYDPNGIWSLSMHDNGTLVTDLPAMNLGGVFVFRRGLIAGGGTFGVRGFMSGSGTFGIR